MIKNAIIESTMLGREDHGIMTFMIFIKFDKGCSCGIGGFALDQYDENTKTRVFRAKSMEVISKILEVVGVETWEDLPGKYIRFEDNGWGSTVTKIGNIIEDKWFDIKSFFSFSNGENGDGHLEGLEDGRIKANDIEHFAERMRSILLEYEDDEEVCHETMDELMCATLRNLGYGEGIDIFENTPKWYA